MSPQLGKTGAVGKAPAVNNKLQAPNSKKIAIYNIQISNNIKMFGISKFRHCFLAFGYCNLFVIFFLIFNFKFII